MKTLSLIIIATLLSLASVAQPPTEATVYKIELNLDKFHKQYRTGTAFCIVGGAIAFAGVAAIAQDNGQPGLLYAGGMLLTIGSVIHMDAHKYFNKKRRP